MISYIVPVYNGEDCIERCIQSIEEMERLPHETLIIDDGSQDTTAEKCQALTERYPACKWIPLQKNNGVSAARNRGLRAAAGEWIAFVDSDDLLLEGIGQYLRADAGDVVVFPRGEVASEEPLLPLRPLEPGCVPQPDALIASLLANTQHYPYSIGAVWGKAYRRHFLLKNKIFFSEKIPVGEDLLFNLHCVLARGRFDFHDAVVYRYFNRPGSIMNRYHSQMAACEYVFWQEIQLLCSHYGQQYSDSLAYKVGVFGSLRSVLLRQLCHPDNANHYSFRREQFFCLLMEEPYCSRLPKCRQIRSIRKKVILGLIRYRQFFLLNLLCRYVKYA